MVHGLHANPLSENTSFILQMPRIRKLVPFPNLII